MRSSGAIWGWLLCGLVAILVFVRAYFVVKSCRRNKDYDEEKKIRQENKKMKISWWKYPASFIAFWLLVFFGEAIPLLWNALAPAMGRYDEGSLGYFILRLIAPGIGAAIAAWAINRITEEKKPLYCLVNCIVAAMVYILIALFDFFMFNGEDAILEGIKIAIAAVVCIGFSISFGKEIIRAMNNSEKKE